MHISCFFKLALAVPALAASIGHRDDLKRSSSSSMKNLPLSKRQDSDTERAAAVQEAYRHSWSGYKRYAFPNDELLPVSNGYSNSRNAWGASAVDGLSTAIVMRLTDVVDEILDYIPTIDYTTTETEVSLFETTIRYLGGMLSAYDLLKGPFSDITSKSAEIDALLDQSRTLADTLKFAFNTPTGIPYNNLNITSQQLGGDPINGLATTGTLVLEWTRLSDLLEDTQYADLTQRAQSYLLDPMPDSAQPFPGLLGSTISIDNGSFLNAEGGWVGGSDSFYEYLIKMYVYDSQRFGSYRDRWIAAADSTIQNLASQPTSRPDLTFVAQFNGTQLIKDSQHLACFDGGNFLLGGTVLGERRYVDFGLALTDACRATYAATATGIGPESFSWDETAVPADQTDFFQRNGFWIRNAAYNLRPEVIESYYHAYRVTGDPKYAEWVWEAFGAVNATTRTESGFSSIDNVNVEGGGTKTDLQESFWFAEVLKYCYLTFAPDAPYQISSNGQNEWVYNTECHPLKVAGTPASNRFS